MRQKIRLFFCLALSVSNIPAYAQLQVWGEYPPVPHQVAETTLQSLHDVSQIDPLRNLQRFDDVQVQSWLAKQNDFSSHLFNRLSGRDALLARLRELNDADLNKNKTHSATKNTNVSILSTPIVPLSLKSERLDVQAGGFLFYTFVGSDNCVRLLMRDVLLGNERVLLIGEAGEQIRQIVLSPDMKKVAVVVRQADASANIRIISIPEGELLKDSVSRLSDNGINNISLAWTADSNSLLFSREINTSVLRKSEIWQHMIAQPEKFDRAVIAFDVKNMTSKRLKLASTDALEIKILAGTPLVMLTVDHGVGEAKSYFYVTQADLKGVDTTWKNFAAPSDKIDALIYQANQLLLWSTKKNKNGELLKLDINTSTKQVQLNQFKELVKSSSSQIKGIVASKDNLYWYADADGVSKLFRINFSTNTKDELPLPAIGKLSQLSIDSSTEQLTFAIESLTTTPGVYAMTTTGKVNVLTTAVALPKEDAKERSPIANMSLLVPTVDGENITVNLSYLTGYVKDQNHPVLIRVGSSGVTPDTISAQVWMEQNGLVVDMNLRSLADNKNVKLAKLAKQKIAPSAAADIVAVAHYLINEGYALSKTMVVEEMDGGSDAVIKAMQRQPDLFTAVSAHDVASEALPNEAFKSKLKSFAIKSAYEDLRADVAYPAILLTVDFKNTVPPAWMTAKLAAGLQILSTNKNKPVLLQTIMQNGAEQDSIIQTANRWAFFLWQIGDKNFYLQSQKISWK